MKKKLVSVYCKSCDEHFDFFWDCDKDGFAVFCPKCGTHLLLCDECIPAEVRNPQECIKCKCKAEPVAEGARKLSVYTVKYYNAYRDRGEFCPIIAYSAQEAMAQLVNMAELVPDMAVTNVRCFGEKFVLPTRHDQ